MSTPCCSACGAQASEFDVRCGACSEPLPDRSLAGTTASSPSAATAALDPGELVADRFRIESELGRGGMGIVHRAHDVRLDAPCAVKILLQSGQGEPGRRFEREARLAAKLRSRHVVTVLDHGVHRGEPFIAMELLEGETLAARLARVGRLDARATLAVIDDLARGLDAAHTAGVVHRDLKPENVFLAREDGEEVAKILDFGIAKPVDLDLAGSATATGALLGTPRTMSPEQAAGARDVDRRADLWSLAVVAFRCITGRMPFEEETLGALIGAIQHAPIPVPSAVAEGVPRGFDAWWARGAARDRDARFQDALAMAAALEEALRTDAASPGHHTSAPPPHADRGRRLAWGGIIAVAAIAVLAVSIARGPGAGAGAGAPPESSQVGTKPPSAAMESPEATDEAQAQAPARAAEPPPAPPAAAIASTSGAAVVRPPVSSGRPAAARPAPQDPPGPAVPPRGPPAPAASGVDKSLLDRMD